MADRYTMERELGRGAMATVYVAADLKHHRGVAIKVLKPELAAALGPERFLREIELAARLTHPHILALHDSGQAGGVLYYLMAYIQGGTLRGPPPAGGPPRVPTRRGTPLNPSHTAPPHPPFRFPKKKNN